MNKKAGNAGGAGYTARDVLTGIGCAFLAILIVLCAMLVVGVTDGL